MSNSLNTYTIKQLDEAEKNLIEQIKRIRAERKSRKDATPNQKESSSASLTLSSLWGGSEKTEKSEKSEKSTEKKSVKVKATSKNADGDNQPIDATIASIKEVLDYHEIEYPKKANKNELCEIVRKHRLVRECEKKESNKKSA